MVVKRGMVQTGKKKSSVNAIWLYIGKWNNVFSSELRNCFKLLTLRLHDCLWTCTTSRILSSFSCKLHYAGSTRKAVFGLSKSALSSRKAQKLSFFQRPCKRSPYQLRVVLRWLNKNVNLSVMFNQLVFYSSLRTLFENLLDNGNYYPVPT